MNIGIIGYGKMGQAVEKTATQKGHKIIFKIDSKNTNLLNNLTIKKVDLVIEFSTPSSALENILFCLKNNKPIVSGTTGWTNKLPFVKEFCLSNGGSFLHAPNFSIGVNLFFEMNTYISRLIDNSIYHVTIEEKHHTMKIDQPSGTAIHIANNIKKNLQLNHVPIHSKRTGNVKGEHLVKYTSEMDEITISHKAKNRDIFAKGAVLAAEFIKNKKGYFTMKDVLNF